MNKEEFLKAIMELPNIETDNPISTMTSISVNDLMSAVDRLNKIPDYNDLLKENEILKENAEHNDKVVDKVNWENMLLKKKNKQLKDKISKIETLIINHNCDTGDIYYKYNRKFLKSELKQRILEILYEEGSD